MQWEALMYHEERAVSPAVTGDGSAAPSPVAEPAPSATSELPSSSSLLRFALFALGLVAAVPWLTNQLGAFTHGQGVYDLSVYYAAALALRDNAHANIYDPAVLQRAAALHGAYLMPVATLYLYPPLLAIAFIPLTVVSFNAAAYIWAACNIAFWLIATGFVVSLFADLLGCGAEVRAFGRWMRSVPPFSGAGRARMPRLSDTAVFAIALPVILSLMSATFQESIVIGQVSLFVLVLLVLALWLERHGRPGAAGAVLAVATLIKVFPGIFLLYFVLRGKWRAVIGFVAGFVALVVGMALYVGIRGVWATHFIFTNGTNSGQQYQNEALARVPFWLSVVVNHRLSDRWATLLGYVLIALVLAAFVAGLVWAARGLWRTGFGFYVRGSESAEITCAGFAWALCTMVLISPVTWEHHLAWLFPAFIVAVGLSLPYLRRPGWPAQGSWITPAVVLAVVVVGYVLVAHDLPFGYDGRVPFDPSPNFLGKIPVRPFFMIQRPVGGLLLWLATGYLFLRLSGQSATGGRALAEEVAQQTVAADGVSGSGGAADEEVDVQAR
jgi:hypothetical protein